MSEAISVGLEIVFVLMILIHMSSTNKSIARLEEKFEELDTEVFNSKLDKEIEVATPAPRKKRVRKPKVIKGIA